MLAQAGGNPVLVRDVASVVVGNAPRLGIAGMNKDDDIVQGIVLMRRGEKSTPTIQRVEAEVDRVKRLVSKSNVSTTARKLINLTTHTVLHNMVVGILLIFLLQWLFLGDLRSATIVAATIPFALSCAIGLMVLRGELEPLQRMPSLEGSGQIPSNSCSPSAQSCRSPRTSSATTAEPRLKDLSRRQSVGRGGVCSSEQ